MLRITITTLTKTIIIKNIIILMERISMELFLRDSQILQMEFLLLFMQNGPAIQDYGTE